MKIFIVTEDHPEGIEVDWPAIPGTGDFVSFKYGTGTDTFKVTEVEYEADGDHVLTEARIHLSLE